MTVAKKLGLTNQIKRVKEHDSGLSFIEKKRKSELEEAIAATEVIMGPYEEMNDKEKKLHQEELL